MGYFEQALQKLPKDFNYKSLGQWVHQLDREQFNYGEVLPEIAHPESYSRNILYLDPLEIAVLHWPPGVESAIHHHQGFWGYVWVLEGTCDNIVYSEEKGQIRETSILRAVPGGIIAEPDDTIHKIKNPSKSEILVTVHFYYPPLEDLDGMTIFDEQTGSKGTLNSKAKAASFTEPPEHFRTLEKGAVEFIPFYKSEKARTHRICPIIPKPDLQEIYQMISDYYNEQARVYDHFDTRHVSRKAYTTRINQLIAQRLNELPNCRNFLSIACGTGRRALEIRELSSLPLQIEGVDLSCNMLAQATDRGIVTREANIVDTAPANNRYDAASYLYAFGHLANREERLKALKNIAASLKPGGMLFMDVFNLEDETEWGPNALNAYREHQLDQWGYETGDVFYSKLGGEAIAFLHYFTTDEIHDLLKKAGFSIEKTQYIGYVYKSGQQVEGPRQGAIYLEARKEK